MASSLTSVTLTGFDGPTWSAVLNKKTSAGTTFRKKLRTLTSVPAASAAYGIDAIAADILPLAASASTTLDLTSITDIFGQTLTFATVKYVFFLHMATEDDATLTTPASSVSIGGAASNAFALFLGDAASDLITLQAGEPLNWWTPKAAGRTVDGTHKSVKFLNNDSSNAAKVMYVFAGAKG